MNSLKGRCIALIGGGGFIGHNLALSLARQGAQVHIIDSLQINNLLYFATANLPLQRRELYLRIINERLDLLRNANISLHMQDARDYHLLSRLLDTLKPQAIVHLAAIAHAGTSNKDPYSTFDHSLRTLENALDVSRSVKPEQFIYFSSSMVYGHFKTEKVDEEHPLNPIGIYGALKLGGEKMVIAYQQVFDLPYTIIRPSALYGPRCVSRRVGQIFIESALEGLNVKVDGDGTERLDFTYIDDLVQGIELVLKNPNAKNQIFNLTFGQARSLNELLEVLKNEYPDIKTEYVKRDRLMPFRGTLSIQKAKDLLGYSPKWPVEKGFKEYIDWYKRLVKSGEK